MFLINKEKIKVSNLEKYDTEYYIQNKESHKYMQSIINLNNTNNNVMKPALLLDNQQIMIFKQLASGIDYIKMEVWFSSNVQ